MDLNNHEKRATVVHTVKRAARPSGSSKTDDAAIAIDPQLQQRLLRAVSQTDDKAIAVGEIVAEINEVVSPVSLTYMERDDAQALRLPEASDLLHQLPPGADEKLQSWANQTCQSGGVGVHELSGAHHWTLITVPVIYRDCPPEVLIAALKNRSASVHLVTAAMQLGASHLTLWQMLQDFKQARSESNNTSALLELLSSLDNSDSLTAASYVLVNDLCDHLGCSRIALGLTRENKLDCRLTVVSGLSDFDKRSEFTQQIEATLNEAVLRDQVTVANDHTGQQVEGTLAHDRLRKQCQADALISAPLYCERGKVFGAWVFFEDKPRVESNKTIEFVQSSQRVVGSRLSMLRRAQVHPLMRPLRSMLGFTGILKWWLGWSAVVLIVAGMMVPMDYRIGCECQLEPVSRRFVAAPYDGTLQESMVKAGEIVSVGQVLARMDARELRWELAGLDADYKSERKNRDAASARDEVAVAQQADLEMQRLALKMKLLQHRLANLEVKSPIAGVVIAGDLKKSEGAPLTIGQALFEIGPLDQMIVEVAIPEREILYVQEGMQVEVRLDAAQNRVVPGTIAHLFPRSETRDNESVYLAEVHLDNRSGVFRPGMKGTATVISEPHPLGWNLLHKAWESFAMMVGV